MTVEDLFHGMLAMIVVASFMATGVLLDHKRWFTKSRVQRLAMIVSLFLGALALIFQHGAYVGALIVIIWVFLF